MIRGRPLGAIHARVKAVDTFCQRSERRSHLDSIKMDKECL